MFCVEAPGLKLHLVNINLVPLVVNTLLSLVILWFEHIDAPQGTNPGEFDDTTVYLTGIPRGLWFGRKCQQILHR